MGVPDWGMGGGERRWESLTGGMGRGREEVGVPDWRNGKGRAGGSP